MYNGQNRNDVGPKVSCPYVKKLYPSVLLSLYYFSPVSLNLLSYNKRKRSLFIIEETPRLKMAASYSPALHCSTIGASGLNFSVRDGKRWNPTAIATLMGCETCTCDMPV